MTMSGDAPGLGIVRALAPLVPRPRRDEWRAEWEAELAWAAHEGARRGEHPGAVALRLRWRALGALADAAWLRRHHHGGTPVFAHDMRHAARALRRRPGFVAVVVCTLALGIGATTALFSVVHGVLLRPLPFPDAERLVELRGAPTAGGSAEQVSPGASYPDFVDFRAQASTFAQLAAVRPWTVTLTAPAAEPARVPVLYATPSLVPTLGVRPLVGRALVEGDERPGAPPVVVLGHALWQRRWGGDPRVVGRAITIDGVPTTVVGVLPPDARVDGIDGDLWQPVVPGPLERERGAHRYTVVGRLRPGTTLDAARMQVRGIARRLALAHPEDNAHRGAALRPLREAVVGDARPALLLLFGAVTLVLLAGCANLASLFLARGAAREREMAVRAALGAGRGRLLAQWMAESLLLTVAGGAAGLAVAWAGTRALLAFVPRSLPRADAVSLDPTVLGFLVGVSTLVGLAFGAIPALQARRAADVRALGAGGRTATAGRVRTRLRRALVITQMSLATVLVVGAALLLKGVWQLQRAPLAVSADGVTLVQLQLPPGRYDSAATVARFYARLRDEAAAIPGVRSAAVAYEHPLREGWTSSYAIVGEPEPPPGQRPESRVRPVSPGYFRTVGLALRAGRDVSADDRLDTPGVVVVNEAFVRRHFAGRDPIGRVIDRGQGWWPGQPTRFTIVGVVADEPFLGVGRGADPATYYPHAQFPMGDMWLVVRADRDAASLAPLLRERVWRLDPTLPVEQVASLRALLGRSLAEPRFNASLLALFAGAALLLAAIGIYGVLAYTVAQRTREIGVRLALGAARGQVVRHVVGDGLRVAGAGVVLGTAGALALGQALGALLTGVSTRDPVVLAGVVVTLGAVAVGAAWLPARRASQVPPSVALRAE